MARSWLQSAFTLGGGSAVASLYLGAHYGYELMWVQPLAIGLVILIISTGITWNYGRGIRGIRIYERTLKVFIWIIILAFGLVVVRGTFTGNVDWGAVASGLIMFPIAYISWFILQNNSKLLGDDRPQGMSAVRWNLAMSVALTVTLVSVGYTLWTRFLA